MVPLLRAKGGEEKPQVCLVATKDGRPMEAEAMVLPLPPDEALVVNVATCLDADSMIKQANGVLASWRRPALSAMTGRKAMLRVLYGRACLQYLDCAFGCRCSVSSPARGWPGAPGRPCLSCVHIRETSMTRSAEPHSRARWLLSDSLS